MKFLIIFIYACNTFGIADGLISDKRASYSRIPVANIDILKDAICSIDYVEIDYFMKKPPLF